jgi:gluconokinase
MNRPAETPPTRLRWVLVMGVAGCGKSALGQAVAHARGLPFIEGDAFHPQANLAKMRQGEPLTDADRADWLAVLAQQLAAHPDGAVLACSALKRSYRERLRAAVPHLLTVHLALSPQAALARVAARTDHFYPASLVDSQFATLQNPDGEPAVLSLDATAAISTLLTQIPHNLPM